MLPLPVTFSPPPLWPALCSLLILKFLLYFYLFVCGPMCKYGEVRRQLAGIVSQLLPYESWVLNSGGQAWPQVPDQPSPTPPPARLIGCVLSKLLICHPSCHDPSLNRVLTPGQERRNRPESSAAKLYCLHLQEQECKNPQPQKRKAPSITSLGARAPARALYCLHL